MQKARRVWLRTSVWDSCKILAIKEVKMMFCKDIIASDVLGWQDGDMVFINAPTGSGKTTFILKSLLPMALVLGREILYLSNRQILHKQLIKEVCELFHISYRDTKDEKIAELPGITFMTYQTLQERLQDNVILNDNPFYFYVVADEIHYLAEDSAFNPQISRLVEWFPVMQKNVFIAISATIDSALQYLGFYNGGWIEKDEDEYKTTYWREPQKMINRLYGKAEFLYFYQISVEIVPYEIVVFQTVEDIVEEINKDNSGAKWLVFQANKEQASKKLVKNIKKSCAFLCADNKEDEVMHEIVEKEYFSTDVLVTTKVLDNGISLHDSRIQRIVVDTTSQTEFLQMLGRRRRCESDNIPLTLYIPQKSVKYFSWVLQEQILPELETIQKSSETLMRKMMRSEDIYQICRKYFDIREGRLLLNPIAKDNLERRKKFCERILNALKKDEYAFVKEQLSWIGQEVEESSIIDLAAEKKKKEQKHLQEYLISNGGKPMGKQEQKKFREEIKSFFRILLPDLFVSESRIPGIKKINAALSCLGSGWEIYAVSGKKKGEETVWILRQKG